MAENRKARREQERERDSEGCECARIFGEFQQLVRREAGTTEDTYTHNNKKNTESGIEKRIKKVRTKEELGFRGAPKSLLL